MEVFGGFVKEGVIKVFFSFLFGVCVVCCWMFSFSLLCEGTVGRWGRRRTGM